MDSRRGRERCLRFLAQGRTVGVIREKLVISLNTARFHTKNIYVKLGFILNRSL